MTASVRALWGEHPKAFEIEGSSLSGLLKEFRKLVKLFTEDDGIEPVLLSSSIETVIEGDEFTYRATVVFSGASDNKVGNL